MKELKNFLPQLDQSKKYADQDYGINKSYLKKGNDQKYAFDFLSLVSSWEKVVGSLLAKNSRPTRIQNKCLVISVQHSAFASNLDFLSQEILNKVYATFPSLKGKITKLKFIQTSSTSSSETLSEAIVEEKKTKKAPKYHLHDPKYIALKEKINQELMDIEDPELKKVLFSLKLQMIDD